MQLVNNRSLLDVGMKKYISNPKHMTLLWLIQILEIYMYRQIFMRRSCWRLCSSKGAPTSAPITGRSIHCLSQLLSQQNDVVKCCSKNIDSFGLFRFQFCCLFVYSLITNYYQCRQIFSFLFVIYYIFHIFVLQTTKGQLFKRYRNFLLYCTICL